MVPDQEEGDRKTDLVCLETLMHTAGSRFSHSSGKTGQLTITPYPAQKAPLVSYRLSFFS